MTEIVSLDRLDARQRAEAAQVLKEALAPLSTAYREIEAAKAEVETFVTGPERFGFAALEHGHVVGWAGGIRGYDRGWELHPLCVHSEHQRRGLGRRLVGALEEAARTENICTLYVGSDDEFGATTAAGADLFADIASDIRNLEVTTNHPLAFYRKLGFTVNGPGKPDILLAKRI